MRLKKFILVFLAIMVLALVGIGIYSWTLSGKVTERFSSRRWSIPSRVFTDTMLLYPGQRLDLKPFIEKLKRIGYRQSPKRPIRKGQMQVTADGLHIFLYDLQTPWNKREGFPVTITFSKNAIVSMVRVDNTISLPLLEIDPEEIMLFFGPERERRQLVSIQQVPEHLIHAVLAAEDSRFFQHWGVDPRGILRAMVTNIRHGRIRQGGSTITQQLAKNYFLTPDRNLKRKLQEVLLAIIMELKYPKEVILEIYLNEIYLGQKGSVAINGIGEAANFYFGKPLKHLSISEAAAIAGLIKAPNIYSPYVNRLACQTRKNLVLAAMAKKNWITPHRYQTEKAVVVEPAGYTAYGNKAPYFIDYLTRQLEQLYQPEDLATLGLCIYTTLDAHVQMAAENALEQGLQRLERSTPALLKSEPGQKLQGAVVVLQPRTGHILAMVGGRNYNESQFNRITQARRQAGSAFKPFVFVTGLERFSPISKLSNQPRVYQVDGKQWKPKNFQQNANEVVTVRSAIENSHNLATIDLALKVGLDRIIDTAVEFGFTTPFKPLPSLALGAFEVIPLELARAYCIFAAEGISTHPLALKAVSDGTGKLIEQRHLSIERKISSQKAFMMNALLRGVVKNGTARDIVASGIDWPVAGKTGTTNNYRDAWFIGYTPDILALVWVGFDNGDPIASTGSGAALPIWVKLMQTIPHHISENEFRVPTGIVKRTICADEKRPGGSAQCSNSYDEYFLKDNTVDASHHEKTESNFFEKVINSITNIFR
ncbi:MAG: PBP1A family penicillin-binding protein [Desulfobacteraceae bacterium]|jgi:penicillin-binding protein 1B